MEEPLPDESMLNLSLHVDSDNDTLGESVTSTRPYNASVYSQPLKPIAAQKPSISSKWLNSLKDQRPEESMFEDGGRLPPLGPCRDITCFIPGHQEFVQGDDVLLESVLLLSDEEIHVQQQQVPHQTRIGSLESSLEDIRAFFRCNPFLSSNEIN
jgi:hypothetical protein